MEYGTMNESIAQLAYTKKTGNLVHEVGFLHSPTWQREKLEWLGASPDGIVEDEEAIQKFWRLNAPLDYATTKSQCLSQLWNSHTTTHNYKLRWFVRIKMKLILPMVTTWGYARNCFY